MYIKKFRRANGGGFNPQHSPLAMPLHLSLEKLAVEPMGLIKNEANLFEPEPESNLTQRSTFVIVFTCTRTRAVNNCQETHPCKRCMHEGLTVYT